MRSTLSKLADTGPPQRPTSQAKRRYGVGAEIEPHGLVSLRLWAPRRTRVAVVMDGRATVLDRDGEGWFSAVVDGRAGSTYGFSLDDDARLYPDPASRFQPDGPHGLSEVVDPSSYVWRDADWPGIALAGQVFYELHVGTFTAEGTWAGAARRLDRLRALGITTIQLMPIADFAGDFGWGYDGVNWFAPTRLYGRPDDVRAFVDAAHARGLGVILDTVYNHLDGFRLDATQQIFDASPEHILAAVVRRARAAAGDRRLVIIGENEPQDARLVRPAASGGYGLDAVYNDDFHHTARVALTSVREAYYSDFRGTSQELLSAAKRGFLFQGQRYAWQGKRRGTAALDLAPRQFVHFLENHDQVANSAAGLRLCELSAPGELRALTALLLLGPATPLLFQGQESGATMPFLYFAHHEGQLARDVARGRLEFLRQFTRYASPDVAGRQLDPSARATFESCQLRDDDSERAQQFWRLHADLLRLRREDTTIALQGHGGVDGATLDERGLVLRFFGPHHDDRLLVVNLGTDVDLVSRPEPLVAPPDGASWTVLWSSEASSYGGSGTPTWSEERWAVAGRAALLLGPVALGHPSLPHG